MFAQLANTILHGVRIFDEAAKNTLSLIHIWPLVAVVGALMILGDGHGPEFGAAYEAHEGEFLAFEEVFDNDFGAGCAEAMVDEDVVEGVDGGIDVHGDGDTLACGETVGFDDDRRAIDVYKRQSSTTSPAARTIRHCSNRSCPAWRTAACRPTAV